MPTQQDSTIPAAPADLQTFGSTLVTSASQLSTAGTSMSALVQTARVSGMKRAAAAAVAIYGADSQEATAASQAVTIAQAKTGQLQIVSQKASTTPPAVASTGWALHGRVYDANLNPQERYTVFLVDAQKNYLSDYGFSYTDATGYFLLQYQGAAASGSSATGSSAAGSSGTDSSGTSAASSERIEESIDPSAILENEDPTSSSSSPSKSASATSTPQAFIQVCDTSANPVLSSSTPLAPVTGQATYQVLTLSASGQSLGDPPAEIRAVAMPTTKAKTTKASKKSADPGTSASG
jgi:hypothetical protein